MRQKQKVRQRQKAWENRVFQVEMLLKKKVTFRNLGELKEKAPEMYKKMLEAMAKRSETESTKEINRRSC